MRTVRRASVLLGLSGLMVAVFMVATAVGSVSLPASEVLRIILSQLPFTGSGTAAAWPDTHNAIVLDIRLPRVVLAALVGAALALAGAAFQGLFQNPMADSYVMGVSSGAALGATVAILKVPPGGWFGVSAIPVLAFAGAIGTVMLVYRLATVRGYSSITALLLAGLAVGSIMMALVSYLMLTAGEQLDAVVYWLMGSFSGRGWPDVRLAVPHILLGSLLIMALARDLNALLLGEEPARHLGIDVEWIKRLLLIGASWVTAAAVAVSGLIGFVGLIVPHLVRLVFGPDHRLLLPAAALVGAAMMVSADTVARTVLSPQEVPVGIVTAVIGGPFFIYLLRQRERERLG